MARHFVAAAAGTAGSVDLPYGEMLVHQVKYRHLNRGEHSWSIE